jgi:hypothetical protein
LEIVSFGGHGFVIFETWFAFNSYFFINVPYRGVRTAQNVFEVSSQVSYLLHFQNKFKQDSPSKLANLFGTEFECLRNLDFGPHWPILSQFVRKK